MLKSQQIADWPNMKKKSREDTHRQLYEQAYPASFKGTRKINNKDLARILGG